MSRLSTLASQLVVLLCVLTVGVRCSVIECCTEVDLIGPLYYREFLCLLQARLPAVHGRQ